MKSQKKARSTQRNPKTRTYYVTQRRVEFLNISVDKVARGHLDPCHWHWMPPRKTRTLDNWWIIGCRFQLRAGFTRGWGTAHCAFKKLSTSALAYGLNVLSFRYEQILPFLHWLKNYFRYHPYFYRTSEQCKHTDFL